MLDSKKIPKFQTQMTIPPVFEPVGREGKNGVEEYYVVEACAFDQQMLPAGYPKTRVFGYGGMCKDEKRKEGVYCAWNNILLGICQFSNGFTSYASAFGSVFSKAATED